MGGKMALGAIGNNRNYLLAITPSNAQNQLENVRN